MLLQYKILFCICRFTRKRVWKAQEQKKWSNNRCWYNSGSQRWHKVANNKKRYKRHRKSWYPKYSTGITWTNSSSKTSNCWRNVLSAFSLMIDDYFIKHIQKCTETEARTKLKIDSCTISFEEVYATIGIMYAWGFLVKGQPVESLWSMTWGHPYFRETMSGDRFKEIMKFLWFDIRSKRSTLLQTDKFA